MALERPCDVTLKSFYVRVLTLLYVTPPLDNVPSLIYNTVTGQVISQKCRFYSMVNLSKQISMFEMRQLSFPGVSSHNIDFKRNRFIFTFFHWSISLIARLVRHRDNFVNCDAIVFLGLAV